MCCYHRYHNNMRYRRIADHLWTTNMIIVILLEEVLPALVPQFIALQ